MEIFPESELLRLPPELKDEIFQWLPILDLCSLPHTCRSLAKTFEGQWGRLCSSRKIPPPPGDLPHLLWFRLIFDSGAEGFCQFCQETRGKFRFKLLTWACSGCERIDWRPWEVSAAHPLFPEDISSWIADALAKAEEYQRWYDATVVGMLTENLETFHTNRWVRILELEGRWIREFDEDDSGSDDDEDGQIGKTRVLCFREESIPADGK
ncbi:hypothetical protein V5O48_013217 [Marasmius crinis-equi]|uniref:F-box domain-containing protein n=1 Tax=Marasmius crinis-equi TaxID=585013 RepID=A0ABR3F0N5_9AGAR